jgi:colanic acid biosynthesis glycosyl transferase WcaI
MRAREDAAAPRRVLMHAEHFAPGTAAEELAQWLSGRGHAVEAVAAKGTRAGEGAGGWWRVAEERGIRVTRCARRRAPGPVGIARSLQNASFALASAPVLLARARRYRPHLVAAFDPAALALPALLLAARRAGALSWVHVSEAEALGAPLLRRASLVSLSALAAEERLEAAAIAETRRLALPPWVDGRTIFPLPVSPLRETLRLEPDAIVALYAGSLDARHGVDRIIEAARLMPANGVVTFVLAGRGEAWPRLAAASHALPLKLLPWPRAADLNALLGVADMHVLPAGLGLRDVLFPQKLAALLASGRPIIAAGEVSPQLAAAVLPGANDAEGIAAAIVALAADPSARRRRAAAARQAAQDYHDKERVFRRLERALGLRNPPASHAAE